MNGASPFASSPLSSSSSSSVTTTTTSFSLEQEERLLPGSEGERRPQ